MLPHDVEAGLRADVARLAPELQAGAGGTGWTLAGPSGIDTSDGSVYSGRILDIAAYFDGEGIAHLFLAAASGASGVTTTARRNSPRSPTTCPPSRSARSLSTPRTRRPS
ncbi:MAG: hypothetical protein R3E97_24535 [Candidatus Eisenbacteria bacterium]